ncbi:hypothetical protein ACIPF8_20090 [Collimonas sp. NPDC087041]|uniref:hypothetical protein n=1 Tax=Collimonas sp. NPDC087041 TaxID=3363960 RepID=UPI00381196D8
MILLRDRQDGVVPSYKKDQPMLFSPGQMLATPTAISYPITGGHCLSCGASFVGGRVACGHRDLNRQTVTAEVARYRTLFGYSEAVVRLSSSGLTYIDYSKDQLVKLWVDDSIFDAIRNAIFFTLAFFLVRQWILLKKRKPISI